MSKLKIHPTGDINTNFPVFFRYDSPKESVLIQIQKDGQTNSYKIPMKRNPMSGQLEVQSSFQLEGSYTARVADELIHFQVVPGAWLEFGREFGLFSLGALSLILFLVFRYLIGGNKRRITKANGV